MCGFEDGLNADPWKECAQLRKRVAEMDMQISMLKSELNEWNQTFGQYGCEPQACLHTLLKAAGPQPPVAPTPTENERVAEVETNHRIQSIRVQNYADAITDICERIRNVLR